jgi:hypothetical protein
MINWNVGYCTTFRARCVTTAVRESIMEYLRAMDVPDFSADMYLCLERDIVGVKKDTGEMAQLASEADLDADLSIPCPLSSASLTSESY